MITVHHLADSRSQRLLWLLEELGTDYRVVRYERDNRTQLAPKALKDLHPLGTSPVVDVDGRLFAESGAIIEYLLARFDTDHRLHPADPLSEAGIDHSFWLHFAEGSMMPMLVLGKVFHTIRHSKMPFFAKPVANQIAKRVEHSYILPAVKKQLAYINDHLRHHEWFAGENVSGADIQMSFPLEAVSTLPGTLDNHAAIRAWLDRIHARPANKRALERGGPYAFITR